MAGNPLTSADLYQDQGHLKVLKKQIDDVNVSLEKTQATAAALFGKTKNLTFTKPGDQKQIAAATAEVDKLRKAEERLLTVQSDLGKEMAIVQERTRRQTAENRAAAKMALSSGDAHARLSAQLAILTMKWSQLTSEEKKNTAEGRRIVSQRKELIATLKQMEAAQGVHNRNVGNYSSALGGLWNTLKNLAAAYIGVTAAQRAFDTLFTQTKALDGLDKAYQQVIQDETELAKTRAFLSDITERYGTDVVGLSKSYLKFRVAANAANFTSDQTNDIFDKVAKSASFMGLSAEETQGVFKALEQIMSKGTVQAEELRGQLGDRLPGAFIIMSEALGVTTKELGDMMKAGNVLATDALPKFAAQLEKTYSLENVDRVDNLAAAQGRFRREITLLVEKIGAGSFFTGLFASLGNITGKIGEVIDYFRGVKKEAEGFGKSEADLNKILSDSTREFNGIIGALKRLEPQSAGRSKMISEINTKYGTYLSNLLTEKSSLEDIAKAQKEVNKAMQERALMEAFTKAVEPLQKRLGELGASFVELSITKAKMDEALATGNFSILDDQMNALREAPTAEARAFFDAVAKGLEPLSGTKAEDFIGIQSDAITTELAEIEKLYRDVAKRLSIDFDSLFTSSGGDAPGGGGIGDGLLKSELDRQKFLNSLREDGYEKEIRDLELFVQEKQSEYAKDADALLAIEEYFWRSKEEIQKKYGRDISVTPALPSLQVGRVTVRPEALQAEFDAEQAHAARIFDLQKHTELEIQRFKINQEIARLELILKLNSQNGKDLTDIERKRLQEVLALLKFNRKEITSSPDGPVDIFDLLGFSGLEDPERQAIGDAFAFAKDQALSYFDTIKELNDQQVEQSNNRVAEAQRSLQYEMDARAQGYADKVATAQKELALAKKAQEQALKQRQKIQKQELALNTALEASSLAVGIANTLKIGPLGIPLVAIMIGAFAAAKIKAFQLANKKTFGKGGLIDVEGGSHASGNDTPLGVNVGGRPAYVERKEKIAVFNKKVSQSMGSELPRIVQAINRGKFNDIYKRNERATEGVAMVNVGGYEADMSGTESRLDKMIRGQAARVVNNPDGSTTIYSPSHKTTIRR